MKNHTQIPSAIEIKPIDSVDNYTNQPNDEIYLPENRPKVLISNAIKHGDLPICIEKSKCQDEHPADLVHIETCEHNTGRKLLHDKWTHHDVKVFTIKYQNLESNKDKKFDLIAKALPNKTAEDCKEFYYLYKHILGFKKPERARKRKIKERKQSLFDLNEPCKSRLRMGRKMSDRQDKKSSESEPQENHLLDDLNKTEKCISSGSVNLCNLFLLADVCETLPEDGKYRNGVKPQKNKSQSIAWKNYRTKERKETLPGDGKYDRNRQTIEPQSIAQKNPKKEDKKGRKMAKKHVKDYGKARSIIITRKRKHLASRMGRTIRRPNKMDL